MLSWKMLSGIAEIPRRALRGNDAVLVVDEKNRMSEKTVTIHSTLRKTVLLSDGLDDGDVLIVTRMSGVLEDTAVEIVNRDGKDVASPEKPDEPEGSK